MPRFVLLHHDCPPGFDKPNHWDLMLEMEAVLRTWELRELPAVWTCQLGNYSCSVPAGDDRPAAAAVTARQLPEHRLAYLDYEGPLTGRRGSVSRCDRGTYRLVQERHDALTIVLSGACLASTVSLTRKDQAWVLELDSDQSI